MTKPLFRTRDLAAKLEGSGICLHFQEQFADAPTTAGGVRRALMEPCCTILDVGGDYIGARAVGAYAPLLRREDTAVYYVINPFRPWSTTLERLDGVFGQILQAARHIVFTAARVINHQSVCQEGHPRSQKCEIARNSGGPPFAQDDFIMPAEGLSMTKKVAGCVARGGLLYW